MFSYKQRYRPRITREYTKSDLTVYDSAGNTALNALTVYGKSEVVDSAIKSAGEGYATVRLADLSWYYNSNTKYFITRSLDGLIKLITSYNKKPHILCGKYNTSHWNNTSDKIITTTPIALSSQANLWINDTDYTTVSGFVASLGDATLCYELADPTQGNTIAIKTDDGSGINGTMAVLSTGTPLYGVSDTVRDVMQWDGSAGTVTKNCGEVDLGTLDWEYISDSAHSRFAAPYLGIKRAASTDDKANILCAKYDTRSSNDIYNHIYNKSIAYHSSLYRIWVYDTTYTDATAFKTAMSGVILAYELETPTTEQLTQTENASIANLRTFNGTTHFTNNGATNMTVNYTIKVPTIS